MFTRNFLYVIWAISLSRTGHLYTILILKTFDKLHLNKDILLLPGPISKTPQRWIF